MHNTLMRDVVGYWGLTKLLLC